MSSSSTPRSIVIAGGGTASWMAAAALARFCGASSTLSQSSIA